MGLDMYLYAQTRGEPIDLSADYDDELYDTVYWRSPDWENEEWYLKSHDLETERAKAIEITKVAYWRKANQIHAWFVDHVQNGTDDCDYYEVNLEQLAGLKTTCQRVLADPSQAESVLPPRQGFFFGGYEVDEYYMSDLKETIEQIEAIEIAELARHDQRQPPLRYWYSSSW
jgi:hypothetical protein